MSSRRVLVIEDDRDTREMLCEILELEGYSVRWASDGAEALRLLRGHESYAAILLDLVLPYVDGLAVLSEMGRDPALRRIPVVALSASMPRGPLPAASFLHKPFSLDELLSQLARLSSGKAWHAPSPASLSKAEGRERPS